MTGAEWSLPAVDTLPRSVPEHLTDVSAVSESLTRALATIGAPCTVTDAVVGPQTISFELDPADGVRMREFTRLSRTDDIAYLTSSASVRVTAPIPGRRAVGVELSRPDRARVLLGDVVGSAAAPLRAALGVGITGNPISLDVTALPHLLIAGGSGSGKSNLLHAMLSSLLMISTPDDLAIVLIDTKTTEFPIYEGLPHLYGPVVTDVERAIDSLFWLVSEVDARYRMISGAGARDINSYNELPGVTHLPRVLCVADEFGDMMLRSRGETESAIVRLGQLGRAAGVHLCLATQSPHREIASGLIKANTLGRIAMKVASATHSRIVIEHGGAEKLLGKGDGLLDDGQGSGLIRFQAPLVSQDTVEKICSQWRSQVDVCIAA